VGLSWTGTDREAARLLAGFFDNWREIEALLQRAGLLDAEAALQACMAPAATWDSLLLALRREFGSSGVDRLFHAAVDLRPDLARFLTAVGTVPPPDREANRAAWPLDGLRLPPLGLGSKRPDFFDDGLSRGLDDDSGSLESLEAPGHVLGDVLGDVRGDIRGDAAAAADRTADTATGFARDPVVTPLVPPRAGGPLVLSVDLARPTGASTGEQIAVSGLPGDWQSLPILARASGVGVTFEPGHADGVVLVYRDADSVACQLFGTIAPDAEWIAVAVTFYAGGRYCGEIRRRFALDAAARPALPRGTTGVEISGMAIESGLPAPDLTVNVRNFDPAKPGLLHWELQLAERHRTTAIPDLPAQLEGEHDLKEDDPTAWAIKLFDTFAMSDTGNLRILEGISQELWAATPECFQQTYWALRAAVGEHFSIQFVCSEPFVPWEFLQPVRGDEALPILMQNHPVARWMPEFSGSPRGTLKGKRIVTIASPKPSHTPPLPELQAAKAQSDRLRDQFNAEPLRATYQDVMALLESKPEQPIAILHFAGHGAIDKNPASARIFLDDDPLTAGEVKRTQVQLGKAGCTMVFLNACSIGQDGRTLGTPGGWPGAFLHRGFRGFLAPISKVWERDAAAFAEHFVELTWRDRLPIGEALRRLRSGADSATPFAYLYYGDVMARFA
jgi:hypothetical protein